MTEKTQKKLRSGYTTGTAAAAAAKAAVTVLMGGDAPQRVTIDLLTGDPIDIVVHTCRRINDHTVVATVIKDAGDDPDVTHKAEIGARLTLTPGDSAPRGDRRVTIVGGKGVGMVTKPGLEVAVGKPAINPGPQKMIRQAVAAATARSVEPGSLTVEVFVPKGAALAEKTLNARLGIIGGISILGTTGIVRPLSHEAYIATIDSALSVARASGLKQVVMATGRRSERFSQALWPDLPVEAFVQIGDYFKTSLEKATRHRFLKASLTVFFGKAVKMAQGVGHTHAAKSRLTLETLSRWAQELSANPEFARKVRTANTARHAFDFIRLQCPALIERVGQEMLRSAKNFAGPELKIRALIYDFNGSVVFDSDQDSSATGTTGTATAEKGG